MTCDLNETCEGSSYTCFEVQQQLQDVERQLYGFVNQQHVQQVISSPMLWIGIYVAVVSLICLSAMAADAFRGFQQRKLWFPCKFFTLNAASLTLLGIAVKLPLDLSDSMPSKTDQLAKLSGTIFLCTVMGNVMPSLGPMSEKDILMNVAALDILVITVLVNVCIQLKTGVIDYNLWPEYILGMCLMVTMLLIFSFSAFVVPTAEVYLERKYGEMHKIYSNDELQDFGNSGVEKLVRDVKTYWMMAETGNPQFVMARSATCSATGAICFLLALSLAEAEFRMYFWGTDPYDYYYYAFTNSKYQSDYHISTLLILVIQTTGVVVGTVGPTSRWFTAISFRYSKKGNGNLANVLKVDSYWIQKLVEWKGRPLALQIRSRKWKKLLHDIKNLILTFCIIVQKVIVVASKIIRHGSVLLSSSIMWCYYYCKASASDNHGVSEQEHDSELDMRGYVMLLQDEEGLSARILKNMSDSANKLIHEAKQQQPKNLTELLRKSTGFKGVLEFDSNQVPYVLPEDFPNCWALPVVTLTSIAVALPNIDGKVVDRLLSSVSEGYLYISLIEKYLNTRQELVNIKNAADAMWLEVELYRKWLNNDLQKMAPKGKKSMENLQNLANISKNVVGEFKNNTNGGVEEFLLNWPIDVIAAHSMYRISESILLRFQDNNNQDDQLLFEQLSMMIADILRACFTNLPRVITMKCFSSAIEKRDESVQQAARLLGETEEILQILQHHEIPSLGPDQLACIDEWRALIIPSLENEETPFDSTISNAVE